MRKTCPKAGIKIHETPHQQTYYKTKNANYSFENDNNFSIKTKEPELSTSNIDFDIDNYSCNDLFKLLGIQGRQLDEQLMKNVKKIVLKTHPDKSKLNSDYYIFFSKAYNRLYSIYIAQNKAIKNINNSNTDYTSNDSSDKTVLLNNFFDKNKDFKDPDKFNEWFNNKFEKHHIKQNEDEKGYGSWLKSDQGIVDTVKINQSQLGSEMEKYKRRIQGIVHYKGIQESFSSSSIVSSDGFSDLKQAYEESVIPVTQADYNKIKKFNSINEYTNFRDNSHKNIVPMSEDIAKQTLNKKNRDLEDECVAITYKNIKYSEKQKQQDSIFWSDLKRLT